MGRFSTGGARLHELRQPKPANAAFRQCQPPQSHGSSLGLEHPQHAIRAARRGKLALDVDVIGPPPVPPAQRWPDPAKAAKGSAPRLLPLEPHRPHARSSAAGLLPGTRRCAPHARHPHRIPGDIGSSPAIRWGCRPSRAFANPALRAASRAYRQTSRARRPCIGGRSEKPRQRLRSVARSRGGFCESRGLASDKSRRACRTPAAPPIAARGRTCPKGPENGLGTGSCAYASAQSAIAAPDAPQERRPAI